MAAVIGRLSWGKRKGAYQCKVSVEENENGPRIRVERLGRPVGEEVHVTGERDVLDHEHQIGHGQTAEDAIDGRPAQLFLAEHDDVDDVGQTAAEAKDQAQRTVHQLEGPPQPLQTRPAVVVVRLCVRNIRRARHFAGVVQKVVQIVFGDVGQTEILFQPYLSAVGDRHCSEAPSCSEAGDTTSSTATGSLFHGEVNQQIETSTLSRLPRSLYNAESP